MCFDFCRIGGLGYVIPAILFWFLGTANIQAWNDIKKPHPDIVTQEAPPPQEKEERRESEATVSDGEQEDDGVLQKTRL